MNDVKLSVRAIQDWVWYPLHEQRTQPAHAVIASNRSPVIHAFPTDIAIGTALAQFLLTAQQEALKDRDTFTIAISGGGMPTLLALGLVDLEGVEWDKWLVGCNLFPTTETLNILR